MTELITLADALPREMARVRDELIPQYQAIGAAGQFGLIMLRNALDEAAQVSAAGDTVGMLLVLERLRGCE